MEESDKNFFESLLVKQAEQSDRRFGVLMENLDHKMDLVVEGQQMLAERLDRAESEIKAEIYKVDRRVTMLAADLAAHRTDTEVHHGIYQVKETDEKFPE